MKRILLSAAWLLCATALVAQTKNDKPNIIIILADDMGYGDSGPFGATDIRTPNIDRLATGGLKFTSFYSTSPVCSPTRAGLITGRYPRRMGIDHVFASESYTGIPAGEVTLAEALKGNGYATSIVGKWHLGHHRQYLPLQNGFDEYYGIPYSNDMAAAVYIKDNEVDSLKIDQRYLTKTYTDKAVKFIEKNKSKPFFLYLAHNMPHVPLYASPKFQGKSKRGLYGDVIEELDWSVGEVVEAVQRNGLSEKTLIVFTSDNGPWLLFDIEGGSAGPLSHGKSTTFEGGQRVPGIFYWPGKIKAGGVYDDLAAQLDIYPTVISLTGSQKTQTDKPLDGEDISPILFGKGKRKGNEFAYYSDGKIEAFRQGDWKIRLPHEEVRNGNIVVVEATDTLLFNLKTDIGERNNVLSANRAKARELLTAWAAYEKKIGPTPPRLIQRMPADNSHIQKRDKRLQAQKSN
jgi:arylsulfatase A-like enzyme